MYETNVMLFTYKIKFSQRLNFNSAPQTLTLFNKHLTVTYSIHCVFYKTITKKNIELHAAKISQISKKNALHNVLIHINNISFKTKRLNALALNPFSPLELYSW